MNCKKISLGSYLIEILRKPDKWGVYGCVRLHKIKELNNAKYWFKGGKANELLREYKILNYLKEKKFKYMVDDYTIWRGWLITKHAGESMETLLKNNQISIRECRVAIKNIENELERCEYHQPDFALRNILVYRNKKTFEKKFTLIDFDNYES